MGSRSFYFASLFILIVGTLSAQEQGLTLFNNSKHRVGLDVGYGAQDMDFKLSNLNDEHATIVKNKLLNSGQSVDISLDVRYTYDVKFFQLQYYYGVLRRKTWGIDMLVQPQYNLTSYKPVDDGPRTVHGYEFGVNFGVVIRKNFFNDFLSIYFLASIGPHYVSGTPSRQTSGFIFSDNIMAGINVHLLKGLYLDIRPGFRHISNAGLKEPNGGLNTLVISGGLFYNIGGGAKK